MRFFANLSSFLNYSYDCGVFMWEYISTVLFGGDLMLVILHDKMLMAHRADLTALILLDEKLLKMLDRERILSRKSTRIVEGSSRKSSTKDEGRSSSKIG